MADKDTFLLDHWKTSYFYFKCTDPMTLHTYNEYSYQVSSWHNHLLISYSNFAPEISSELVNINGKKLNFL